LVQMSGAEAVVACLKAEGVQYVFGVSGSSTLPILDVLTKTPEIKYISTRHEQIAVYMADGYARASGRLGAVLVTRAAGAANVVIGTITAFSSDSPVLVIAGQAPSQVRGRGDYQEFDLVSMFKPITKFSYEVERASKIPEVLQRAIRIARHAKPGPVFLSIPSDLLAEKAEVSLTKPEQYNIPFRTRPDPTLVDSAARILADAKKPAIIASNGVVISGASRELVDLAEVLAAPVFPIRYRLDVIPTDHPLYVRDGESLVDSDVLLVVGTDPQDLGTEAWDILSKRARIVQIELDCSQVASFFPVEVGIVADPKMVLAELVGALKRRIVGEKAGLVKERFDRLRRMHEGFLAKRWPSEGWDDVPIRPWRLVRDLRETLDKKAMVSHDSGSFSSSWIRRCFDFYEPNTCIQCLAGCMGFAFPGALGVKLARPERQVVSIVGDGSFMMVLSGLNTATHYGIPITVVVNNNSSYMQIKRRQKPPFLGSELTNPDFARVAQLFGAYGERVEKPGEIKSALKRCLEQNKMGKPALLDVVTTSDVRYSTAEAYFAGVQKE